MGCVRSSHPEVFYKNDVFKNFAKFTIKHLSQSLFPITLQTGSLQLFCNFIQKEALSQVFYCEFCKILRSAFFLKTSGGCFFCAISPVVVMVILTDMGSRRMSILYPLVSGVHQKVTYLNKPAAKSCRFA